MNVLLKQTLDVLIHLVRCGYYSSVKDVDEIMILLIKVLDESNQPKGKAKIILYVTFFDLKELTDSKKYLSFAIKIK